MIAKVDHRYFSDGGWQSQTLNLFAIVYDAFLVLILLNLLLLLVHVDLVCDGVLDAALSRAALSKLRMARRFLTSFGSNR